MLFASASPVGREDLARLVGQGVSVELLIEDIQAELSGRHPRRSYASLYLIR